MPPIQSSPAEASEYHHAVSRPLHFPQVLGSDRGGRGAGQRGLLQYLSAHELSRGVSGQSPFRDPAAARQNGLRRRRHPSGEYQIAQGLRVIRT